MTTLKKVLAAFMLHPDISNLVSPRPSMVPPPPPRREQPDVNADFGTFVRMVGKAGRLRELESALIEEFACQEERELAAAEGRPCASWAVPEA
jgi:hypothetical protein